MQMTTHTVTLRLPVIRILPVGWRQRFLTRGHEIAGILVECLPFALLTSTMLVLFGLQAAVLMLLVSLLILAQIERERAAPPSALNERHGRRSAL